MSAGVVLVRFIMCIIAGVAGSGKTCLKNLLLGESPPTKRTSTALKGPVQIGIRRVTRTHARFENHVWKKATEEDLLTMIAEVVLHTVKGETILSKLKHTLESFYRYLTGRATSPVTEEGRAQSPNFQRLPEASQKAIINVIQMLVKKISQCSSKEIKSEETLHYDWVYFTDSGGQKPFQELLPLFVHENSAIIAVMRLCDRLDDHTTDEYYEEGRCICTDKQPSELNGKEMIEHLIRTLNSESVETNPPKDGSRKQRKLIVVGTHKDEMKNCTESLDEKNEKLIQSLEMLPNHEKHLVCASTNKGFQDIVLCVNTLKPKAEDKKIAESIRSVINGSTPTAKREIPIWWYVLQLVLLELANQLGRSVLSINECVGIAQAFDFDQDKVVAALIFFHQLNVFHYYHDKDGLKDIVFTDSQIPLDKVSELIIHSFHLRGVKSTGATTCSRSQTATEAKWKCFRDHGILTVENLKDPIFQKHYDTDGIFTADKFQKLLQTQLAIAPVLNLVSQTHAEGDHRENTQNKEFLMPSLLETLSSERLEAYRLSSTKVEPLLMIFPKGWPRFGTFCCLVVFLMKRMGWRVVNNDMEHKLPLVARNFAVFNAHLFQVILIDSFSYIEIHLHPLSTGLSDEGLQELCSKTFSLVVRDILSGISAACTALRYEDVAPKLKFGFFCSHEAADIPQKPPNKKIKLEDGATQSIAPDKKHPAELLGPPPCNLLECKKQSNLTCNLQAKHKVWDGK